MIGHLGSPTLDDLSEGTVYWEGLEALADLEQAYLKISMLSYPDKDWPESTLVREIGAPRPGALRCGRCMFASNFPVEKHVGWSADRLYAAFADLVSHLDAADRQRLFADTARRAYRVPEASSG